jgi:hypothetical protein
VNAEFNWWLLIVGLVIGAGLVWLILADSSRREADVSEQERAAEARWIAAELRRAGRGVDDDEVADILDLHAAYLTAPPPDDPDESAEAFESLDPVGSVDAVDPIGSVGPLPERPTWPGSESARPEGRDQPSPSRTV